MRAIDASTTPMPQVPDILGLRFRHFRGIDLDIPGMAAANQAARLADGEAQPVDVDDMRSGYSLMERCDPARDICVIESDGVIVGYARVEWDDLLGGTRDYWSVTLLSPAVRRPEVIRAMHEWTEARRRAVAAGHRAAGEALTLPCFLATDCLDGDRATTDLLRASGYESYRRFASLVRPDFEAIATPPIPDGLEVRSIVREDALMRRIFDAEMAAFRDEFNARDTSENDYSRFLAESGQDLALWSIAFDGDEVAGGVRSSIKLTHDGVREGWLDPVFTGQAWRRRGLARALIGRTLILLREQGADRAALVADLQSPNQTLALYESCGFRLASSTTSWHKPLVLDAAAPAEAGR
ncbi:MAG TPA: GNAT family N-acetyltransferase [Candidatus Limnocylindrales bacterium]